MNTRIRLAALFVLLVGFGLAHAAEPKKDDVVWAEFQPNAWYRGKVTKAADRKFDILFDDGDTATVKAGQIAHDKEPTKKDVKEGTAVLAKYQKGSFYPGKIDKVTADGKYDIKFDDGDTDTVTLEELRLIHK